MFTYAAQLSNCPVGTTQHKLKYGQLDVFEYTEKCGGRKLTDNKALLGP